MPPVEMNDAAHRADPELFRLAQEGFLAEADHLARLAETPDFKTLLEFFEDYPDFLRSRRNGFIADCLSGHLKELDEIDFASAPEPILKLTNAFNLAAACDLFDGWTLPLDSLEAENLANHVKRAIREQAEDQGKVAAMLARKLNSGDASRVIHMLKLCGWIAPDMTGSAQLSLGASGGTRDRYSIHQIPKIHFHRYNPLLRKAKPESITFELENMAAHDVVLVDNDPKMAERYEKLNASNGVLALNLDANRALEELAARIDRKELRPRDFVVAFRIDHRMIPDSDSLLQLLGSVIADTAALVITIGAGHTNSEFRGRLEKIEELREALRRRGLNPKKIKWHRGSSLPEQRGNPVFGAPTYATYEILYCTLKQSALTC